jgi:ribosomal protein S18 acetylase RimI-like enzyme
MTLTIRLAERADLPAVLALWQEPDVHRGHTDDLESLELLMDHDPAALIVAESAGRIVGSVIAGFDGWRGAVYRLVVAPGHRRMGLGRRLVTEAETRLAEAGAVRLHAIVVESDDQATGFWQASGWERQQQRLRFVKG